MVEARGQRDALKHDRAARQAKSIRAALRARGMGGEATARIDRAVTLGMSRRTAAIDDDHHPAYLHPGRSALILLHDVEELPQWAPAIAAVHESRDDHLRPPSTEVRAALGDEIAARVEALPLPQAEGLSERLVLLERDQAVAVLAERLDHLRHLHMRPDTAGSWADVHEEVERVWAPFAQRTDARLSTRFAHWTRTFRKRMR